MYSDSFKLFLSVMFDVTKYINKLRPPGSFRNWKTETQTKLALNSNPHERSTNQWPCRTVNKWIFTTWTNTDGTSGILRSSISYTWAIANVGQQDIFIKGNAGSAQWKHCLFQTCVWVEIYSRNVLDTPFLGTLLSVYSKVLLKSTHKNVFANCRHTGWVQGHLYNIF